MLLVASTDFLHRLIPPTALRSCISVFRDAVLGIPFVISISCDNNTNIVIEEDALLRRAFVPCLLAQHLTQHLSNPSWTQELFLNTNINLSSWSVQQLSEDAEMSVILTCQADHRAYLTLISWFWQVCVLFLPLVVPPPSCMAGCLGSGWFLVCISKMSKIFAWAGTIKCLCRGNSQNDPKFHTVTRGGVSRALLYLIQLGI